MKNIQSLNLSGCHISFHNGLYRKFYPEYQRDASESVLTFHYIMQFIEFQAAHLKSLNFSETLIDGNALTRLAQIKNLYLERLHLRSCDNLRNIGISMFVNHQNTLVELDLSLSLRLTDPSLIEICRCLLQLRSLKLRRCRAITNQGVKEIRLLKKLECLDLSECDAITSTGFIEGVVNEENDRLLELHVSALNICELSVIKIAESLKNLMLLDLSFCRNAVTNLGIQMIFKHLTKLRTLNLEFCEMISDAGVTGMEMCSKVEKYEKTKLELDQRQNTGAASDGVPSNSGNVEAVCHNAPHEIDAVDHPVEELRRELQILHNEPANARQPLHISLRSKAEEDIVNDAKRKKTMLNMYEQPEQNKENINCSLYSISRLKGLRSLNLTSCNKLSDVSLKYAFDFVELKQLSLSRCQQVSAIGLECLQSKCPSIEELNLSECHNLTDQAIDIITQRLKRLTHLHLERCSQLTDHSLDAIALNCKRLKFLDVRGCRSMCSEPNLRLGHMRALHRILMSKPGPYMTSLSDSNIKLPKAPPLPSSF